MMPRAATALLLCGGAAGATMRAGVYTKYALGKVNLKNLVVENVTAPTAGEGQALVRIGASSINPCDWKGLEAPKARYPFVPGHDVAGTIAAVGAGCAWEVGDEVYGMAYAGDPPSPGAGGAWAEVGVVDCGDVAKRPKSLTVADAAALPLVTLTGVEGMKWAGAPWQTPKTVLVLGGGGGCGHTGIQLAKAYGAGKVITTCEPGQAALMKSLGADQTIDYHTANWWEVLKPGEVDVIYNTIGVQGSGEHAYDIIADSGRYFTIAGSLASKAAADKRPSVEQYSYVLGSRPLCPECVSTAALDELSSMSDAGKLKAVVQKAYPLADFATAVDVEMGGQVTGKLVIQTA